jgi:hypothetical protein
MILIINKCLNKITLIKILRENSYYLNIENDKPLSYYVSIVNNLPHAFPYLTQEICDRLGKEINNLAEFSLEKEINPYGDDFYYNSNIEPPIEVKEALIWYDSLSDDIKKHIINLHSWWSRPAVC